MACLLLDSQGLVVQDNSLTARRDSSDSSPNGRAPRQAGSRSDLDSGKRLQQTQVCARYLLACMGHVRRCPAKHAMMAR